MIKNRKRVIIASALSIILITLSIYHFYPQDQEIIVCFTDGSEQIISNKPFAVNYKNKQTDRIIFQINKESDIAPYFISPIGQVTPIKISDSQWMVNTAYDSDDPNIPHLIDYSLEEGKHEIIGVGPYGEIRFTLDLVDNRELNIVFG